MKYGVVLCLLLLVLTGCGHDPLATPSLTPAQQQYRLSDHDVVLLRVYDEPEFGGKYTLDSAGRIALPLAGKVNLRGQTEEQAGHTISRQLKEKGLLHNPRVSVELAQARPYYILGEVNKAGEYPFHTGLTVYQAVARSGGFTYRADRGEIKIRRKNEAGAGRETRLSATEDTPVFPGDTIEIGERYF